MSIGAKSWKMVLLPKGFQNTGGLRGTKRSLTLSAWTLSYVSDPDIAEPYSMKYVSRPGEAD